MAPKMVRREVHGPLLAHFRLFGIPFDSLWLPFGYIWFPLWLSKRKRSLRNFSDSRSLCAFEIDNVSVLLKPQLITSSPLFYGTFKPAQKSVCVSSFENVFSFFENVGHCLPDLICPTSRAVLLLKSKVKTVSSWVMI